MAYAAYKLGEPEAARVLTLQALEIEDNERLRNNLKYYGGEDNDSQ